MSLHRRAARRDDNEAPIVEALRAVGADVRHVSSRKLPDLVVALNGVTVLLGVKRPDGPRGGKSKGRGRKDRPSDQRPDGWQGGPWLLVTTPGEAVTEVLRAVGLKLETAA